MPPILKLFHSLLSYRVASLCTRKFSSGKPTPRRTHRALFSSTRPNLYTSSFRFNKRKLLGSAGFFGSTFSALLFIACTASSTLYAEAPPERDVQKTEPPPTERIIRLAEVRIHGQNSPRPWVVRGTSVYDITDWVAGHPGGNVILRAAGGSIEPYWEIFTIHQKQDVYDILQEFFIGSIDPQDLRNGEVPADEIEDPFIQDPVRDPQLHFRTDKPCNAETPKSELSAFLTSNRLFFVRNHLWVPRLDETSHKLVVELPDGEEKEYTMQDLKTSFIQHKVIATLQCSGNRRKHMTEGAHATNGLQWDAGAIGNAEWTGPRLRDVLADAGFAVNDPPEDAKHAQFVGAESYGASIPLAKAIDPQGDVILACQMNGEELPPDHGFPLRAIVPGHVAARSVKWIHRVIVSEEESRSQWQRRDYKCFGPNDVLKPSWDEAPAIQETPVQSAITSIRTCPAQKSNETPVVMIEGYAFSGGGREIVRVDVSTDNGKTWAQADIDYDPMFINKLWSWKRWKYTVPKDRVGDMMVVKAVDKAYNTQPESYEGIYNVRGNLTTAWHRVPYNHDLK